MKRILKYTWFFLVMKLSSFMPDFRPLMRFRGFLLRCCFKSCGRNFQICSHAMIICPSDVSIGNDVYIAYGCWLHGYGGIRLDDEVMLAPYTILVANNHVRKNSSFRFATAKAAPIVVGRGSWTGSHVTVVAGCTIGAGTAVAAGSVVTRDLPPDSLCGGIPARVIRSYDSEQDTPEKAL